MKLQTEEVQNAIKALPASPELDRLQNALDSQQRLMVNILREAGKVIDKQNLSLMKALPIMKLQATFCEDARTLFLKQYKEKKCNKSDLLSFFAKHKIEASE